MIAHEKSAGARKCGRSSVAKLSADDQRSRGGRRRGESVSVCNGGGPTALQVKVDIPEPIAGNTPPEPKTRQQAMDLPEWEEMRKGKEVEMHGIVKTCVYSLSR